MTRSWGWFGWVLLTAGCSGGGADGEASDSAATDDTGTDTGVDSDTDSGTETLTHFTSIVDWGAMCPFGDDCLGSLAFAMHGDGQGFAAWVHDDPNADGDGSDTVVEFTRSDGATTWEPVRALGPAGDLYGNHQLDLAIDAASDEVVACWAEVRGAGLGDGGIHVATSHDRGTTWEDEIVRPLGELVSAKVDCDLHDGVTVVGYSGPEVAITERDEPDLGWTTHVPPPIDTEVARGPVAVGIRPSDLAGFIAYFDEPDAPTTYNRRAFLWSPEVDAPPQVLMDSADRQADFYDVALQFDGDTSWVVANLPRLGVEDTVFVMSSDDQVTWTDDVGVPNDDGQSFGEAGSEGSLDLSVGSGRLSVGLEIAGATDGAPLCGAPKLVDTTDGSTFALCNLTGAAANGGGQGIQVVEDLAGHRQALFWTRDAYGPIAPGVVQWVE